MPMDRIAMKPHLNMQILEEAADWMIELATGEADHPVRQRFDAWLRTSPEHVRAYLELLPVWEDGPSLPPRGGLSVEQLLALAKTDTNVVALSASESAAESGRAVRTETIRARAESNRTVGWWPHTIAVAATVLIAVGASMGTWIYAQRGTYVTDIGEQRSLSLEDGSTINLNARSKIRVRFSGERREVDLLDGQALFQIARDATRPFVVDTGDTRVRAVGTQFDVSRRRRGTVVTVLEGSVAVIPSWAMPLADDENAPREYRQRDGSSGASNHTAESQIDSTGFGAVRQSMNEVMVTAGEQLTVGESAVSHAVNANVVQAIAWTQRRLVFDASTLGEVVDEFNRYNTRPLVIRDSVLETLPITAAFKTPDAEPLVRFLKSQPNIRVTETSEAIEIFARP